jgi:hypothetical protein
MKKPKPSPPRGAPAGTIWFGGPISWFALGIEITADDLKPDEITSLLGVKPTHQHERGELRFGKDGTPRRPPKFGRWALRIESGETDEWDANEAAKLLIAKFTADPIIWNTISSRATVRLTLALILESANQGFSLDPDVLRWLADRNVRLDIDIYEGDSETEIDQPAESDCEPPPH